jgi:hypothetical protein
MAIDEELIEKAPIAEQTGAPDLFIGITGYSDAEALRDAAAAQLPSLVARLPLAEGRASGPLRVTVAAPGLTVTPAATAGIATNASAQVRFVPCLLPASDTAATPWALAAAAERSLLAQAAEAQAKACVLLHPDLHVMTGGALAQLAQPILDKTAELVVPIYDQGRYDGLLNSAILAPLNRALYGRRVSFPLAPDFAVSPRMMTRLVQSAHSGAHVSAGSILWPATVAATIDAPVVEVLTGVRHGVQTEGLELSAVIAQLVGSVFAEMEQNAPLWQRVRGSHPSRILPAEIIAGPQPRTEIKPEVKPLIDSFLLGSRSLQEVWGLVLPPVTLLDLKRLTLVSADKFRIPDELWSRIIYDFALAFRLRAIARNHLLGALAPLYLGWIASYVNEVGANDGHSPSVRHEQLAKAFEDGKPYLVRRWRWPDRFNP